MSKPCTEVDSRMSCCEPGEFLTDRELRALLNRELDSSPDIDSWLISRKEKEALEDVKKKGENRDNPEPDKSPLRKPSKPSRKLKNENLKVSTGSDIDPMGEKDE